MEKRCWSPKNNSDFSFVAATVKIKKAGRFAQNDQTRVETMSPIRNVIEQNSGRAKRPLPWHRLAKRMQSKPVVLPLVWLEHADNSNASNSYSRLEARRKLANLQACSAEPISRFLNDLA
jgi:hypothetical protein